MKFLPVGLAGGVVATTVVIVFTIDDGLSPTARLVSKIVGDNLEDHVGSGTIIISGVILDIFPRLEFSFEYRRSTTPHIVSR